MEKELIVLIGPIGSGKTTFSKTLQTNFSIRISQDEMGRRAYLDHFHQAIQEGVPRVIIDRQNFNRDQRSRFVEPARKAGYCITFFEFDWDWDICFSRVTRRKNHPTIERNNPELTEKILHMYQGMYERPEEGEYDNYNKVELDV